MANIAVSVKMEIKNDQTDMQFKENIKKWFDEKNKYQIVVDTPYASYIENGSNPASGAGGYKGEIYNKILEWVKEKGITPRNSRNTDEQTAFLIYRHIMNCGITPHPFVQPAIIDFFSNGDADYYFSGRGSNNKDPFNSLANALCEKIRQNIIDDEIMYTGNLLKSVRVEIADRKPNIAPIGMDEFTIEYERTRNAPVCTPNYTMYNKRGKTTSKTIHTPKGVKVKTSGRNVNMGSKTPRRRSGT